MARETKPLSDVAVKNLSKPGKHPDGGGLYLRITEGVDGKPRKSWLFRARVKGGKVREIGLGAYPTVSLKAAREGAKPLREIAAAGVDPVLRREQERQEAALAAARALTFREVAERYIETHKSKWSNAKHAAQWTSTLETYAYPVIGKLPVGTVSTEHVTQILEPIWSTKTETASRVRGRIEAVLSYAKARGFRSGENPARWRGHFDQILPPPSKVRQVEHHGALDWREAPTFWRSLSERQEMSARALRFTILTAARTKETMLATWDQVDLDRKLWTVPASVMKNRKPHRVALSSAALDLLEELAGARTKSIYLFPGGRNGDRPISNMAMAALLKRMKVEGVTPHGFRSTFRDWAEDGAGFPRELAEMALSHSVGTAVEQAYRRGDGLERRWELMEAWACYLSEPKGEVVELSSALADRR